MIKQDIILLPHQKEAATHLTNIINAKSVAYLFGPPRVGKTLTALYTMRRRVLVLTKKTAIKSWTQWLPHFDNPITVTNYEQVDKLNSQDYDEFIIDEAHNLSAFPRPSKRLIAIRKLVGTRPVLLLSGTPVVEGPHRLYSQFSVSAFSPFKSYGSPYDFFRQFGTPHRVRLNGYDVELYDRWNEKQVLAIAKEHIYNMSYSDAGFTYNNTDEIHNLSSPELLKILRNVRKEHFIDDLPLENISAVNQCAHRVCGGFYETSRLPQPKLKWLDSFIDSLRDSRIAVMAYFIDEQKALQERYAHNKNITVLSSTKYCEGVDLSDYDSYILYSFGYSGAKFVQLRDRIVNITKDRPTKVIIPLIKGGIDEAVYNAVSNKRNFNLKAEAYYGA